jgi:hypothetical protein
MKLKQILILFILVFILIIWYYNKKEHFNTIFGESDHIQCLGGGGNVEDCDMNPEIISDQYFNSQISTNNKTSFYTLNNTNISIKKDNLGDKFIKSFGFYIKINSNNGSFMKLKLEHGGILKGDGCRQPMCDECSLDLKECIKCANHKYLTEGKCVASADDCPKGTYGYSPLGGDQANENKSCEPDGTNPSESNNREVLFTKSHNTISIEYKGQSYNLLLNENDIKCKDVNGNHLGGCSFFWIFINLKETNDGTKLEINLNNTTKTLIPIDFNTINEIKFLPIDGKIGNILGFDQTKGDICGQYHCLANKPDTTCNFDLKSPTSNSAEEPPIYINSDKSNNKNANYCIDKCYEKSPTNNCNIKECQSRCLECKDVNGLIISRIDRDTYCPWYNNLRIKPSAPEPPKIRGFSDEKDTDEGKIPIITLEWRKPHHNMSKIINYIIEIKDLLYKNGTQVITIPQENTNIFQEDLENLKPQTTYEICIRAVGEIRNEYNDSSVNELIDNVIGKKSNILTITTGGENNKILKETYDYLDGDYSNSYDKYQCSEQINSDHILNNIDHDDINIYKTLQKL